MGISVEVDRTNFQQEVIEASFQRPVIVDFFATWCGPCKMLKPVLEKLVNEYDFVLAKVDIDRDPELAQTYHVEGVPDVRIVSQGQVQPGFVGMVAEPQIRDLLASLHLKSSVETDLEAAQQAAIDNLVAAKAQFDRLIEQYPQHRQVAIAAAKFFIQQQEFDRAEAILSQSLAQPGREQLDQVQALRDLMRLQQTQTDTESENELDAKFSSAIDATLHEAYESALQSLLEIVGRDRKYRNDGARKAMLLIFSLLSDDHPLTKHYRKQLTLTLY